MKEGDGAQEENSLLHLGEINPANTYCEGERGPDPPEQGGKALRPHRPCTVVCEGSGPGHHQYLGSNSNSDNVCDLGQFILS